MARQAVDFAGGAAPSASARAAGPTAVLGRSSLRTEDVWARAQRLLDVEAAVALRDDDFAPGATEVEKLNAQALHNRVRQRVRDAGDPERLATSLNWLDRYRRAYPHLRFLHQRGGPDDLDCARRNEAALASFEVFVR